MNKRKEGAEYGKQVLKELLKQLTIEFGKGFSVDNNLQNMSLFFLAYSNLGDDFSQLQRLKIGNQHS